MSSQASQALLVLRASLLVLAVSSAAAAAAVAVAVAVKRKRKNRATQQVSQAAKRAAVEDGARLLLAVDIGSSSVRCSAYVVGSPPLLVPGCAVQIKHPVVRDCGTADADEVVDLVESAVDRCFSELRLRDISHAVVTVGFACFGMNLVGVDEDGKPCTQVYTYANTNTPSVSASGAMKRLRDSLERTGRGGAGGLEEARRRTGTPTHVSYAPVQLLQWLEEEEEEEVPRWRGLGGKRRPNADTGAQQQQQRQRRRRVRAWQTLPSLVAARWCRLPSAPVSYSEASWMGVLDLWRLEWDTPTLTVLRDAGFDCSTLPRLADVGELGASASGLSLERWPELEGASIRLGVGDGAAACLGAGCDETSGLICVTVGTSAAARVVVSMGTTAAAAVDEENDTYNDSAAVVAGTPHVPKGLWCYRLDRRRAVLGGSLTDGGSVFEWLRTTLALSAGQDVDAVMQEVEEMPPAAHGLVERLASVAGKGARLIPSARGEPICGRTYFAAVAAAAAAAAAAVPEQPEDGGFSYPVFTPSVVDVVACRFLPRLTVTLVILPLLSPPLATVIFLGVPQILPFFSGERSTGYKDDAAACVLGLRRSTTRAQLVRAGLESVCLRLAAVVDLMVEAGAGRGSGSAEQGGGSRQRPDLPLPSGRKENTSSLENQQGCRMSSPTGAVRIGENTAESSPASATSPPRPTGVGVTAAAVAAAAGDDVLRRQDATVVTSGHAMVASPFWQQILADCLGRTVRASGASEETSLGVAVLLSSLEVDRFSCDVTAGRGEARGQVAAGERGSERVCAPSDAAQRAYRNAGLAQTRAYETIFGHAGASKKGEDSRR